MDGAGQRMAVAVAVLVGVTVAGTIGYWLLGFEPLLALYQTVITVTTVGFDEVEPFGTAEVLFSIVLIMAGVGSVLYVLTATMQFVLEGHIAELVGRRRMDRRIAALSGHVVLCGWGRVGRAISKDLAGVGPGRDPLTVVVIESDQARLEDCPHPAVAGDATKDDVLRAAGIERAGTLVAAVASDADNLFITLSGRALQPELFIVARVVESGSVEKLTRAGADRVINPQSIGGARIAAYIRQPNVAEFVDVVMHEQNMEFRLGEVRVRHGSALEGVEIRDAPGGAQVLAVRRPGGTFATNPQPTAILHAGEVVIAVGTAEELEALARAGTTPSAPA